MFYVRTFVGIHINFEKISYEPVYVVLHCHLYNIVSVYSNMVPLTGTVPVIEFRSLDFLFLNFF